MEKKKYKMGGVRSSTTSWLKFKGKTKRKTIKLTPQGKPREPLFGWCLTGNQKETRQFERSPPNKIDTQINILESRPALKRTRKVNACEDFACVSTCKVDGSEEGPARSDAGHQSGEAVDQGPTYTAILARELSVFLPLVRHHCASSLLEKNKKWGCCLLFRCFAVPRFCG